MHNGKSALAAFLLVLVLASVNATHTSENYLISNIAVIPSTGGASESYRLYDAAEEPTGSGPGTSTNYDLWVGFPATVGLPRVPGSLSATVDSNTQITVSWDANGNPGGVTFQLQEASPTNQSLYSGSNTSHMHSSLTPGTQYCYKVRAYNGVYSVYTAQVCASALPGEFTVTSSHTQGAFSTDATVDFNASADANHFYYTWDQLADTAVTASGTWWSGSLIAKEAASDGNWYLHVRSANLDNNLNAGGTMHYGPYNIDTNIPYTCDDANSEWQTTNVNVLLTATDNASGVSATYYCIDTNNSCSPAASGTTVNVTCPDTCQKYARYYSADAAGNQESVSSRLVRIDKQAPGAPTVSDEGSISSDFVLTFTYTTEDNSGSGVVDFYLELRTGSTSGDVAYEGWTSDSDGSYDYLGALNTYTYYARGKTKDAVDHEGSFSDWTDGVYVNATAHPASASYSLDIYTVIPSGQVDSNNYSIYDLVVGQPAVSTGSDNYTAETGFAGGFIENSAPTVSFKSPNSGYYSAETVSIDFNITEAEGDTTYIDLAYSLAAGNFQNMILDDVNLNDFANISGLNCDSNVFTRSTNCTYSWDTSGAQDNNYYFDFNTWDIDGLSNSGSSTGSIMVDQTAPTTTSDYNGEWSGVDISVVLSCNDGTGSGCSLTQYRLDTNPSKTVSFGAWQAYSSEFEVSGDGNWAIDFNSKDVAGSVEATNREYVKINYALSSMGLEIPAGFEIEITEDMNKTLWYKCVDMVGNIQEADSIVICLDKLPPTTGDDINSEWQGSDVNVTLSPYDIASGVSETYYCIDTGNSCAPMTDGSTGTSFTVTCDADSVCNKYVRYLSVDNAGGVEDTNSVLVRIDKNAPGTSVTFYSGWQGDINVPVSCDDASGSGCGRVKYRIDSGAWQYESFVGGDANISVTTDGNHLVEYIALDNVDNNDGIHSGWQAVDKTVPSVTITDPSTDNMEKGTLTISFNVGRLSGSALDFSSIAVDFNGTASDDFDVGTDCNQNEDLDYNCSYTELGLAEDDYMLNIQADDQASNSGSASRPFSYRPVVAVGNVTPSGGFVKGTTGVQFEVQNTMLNDTYVQLFVSDWFGEFDSNISGEMKLDDYATIPGLSCQDATFWDWTQCTYSWDTTGTADGNYFIDVNMWTQTGSTATGHSNMPFIVDNIAPVASVDGVSPTTVYEDHVYLSCTDEGTGDKTARWYYFSPTPTCSSSKSTYVNVTYNDYLDIVTDHNDYICLWCEDKADQNNYVVSPQLHVDTGATVVGSIQSERQTLVSQDLDNECKMYLDRDLVVDCDYKTTIKISESGTDLNRTYTGSPELVISPDKPVRVIIQSELEAFYHKDYFLKFESDQRTVTSQGEERNFPVTVVRRRVMPLLTTEGQLEIGTLTIKIRQR